MMIRHSRGGRGKAPWALVLAAVLGAAAAGAAEPGTPLTLRLQPRQQAGVEQGKVVVVKGEAGTAPQRFLLDGITYMMPVAVALRPVNEGDEVSMSLTKFAWNQPLRQGSTDGRILRYVFRTEGEFQITVTSDQPATPYRLMVWVGDESRPALAPVVIKASEFKAPTPARWPWLVAGMALLGALLALVAMKRRRSA
jgi:hypothetical protein